MVAECTAADRLRRNAIAAATTLLALAACATSGPKPAPAAEVHTRAVLTPLPGSALGTLPIATPLAPVPCKDICVTVLGLTSARIVWAAPPVTPGQVASHYWVIRSQAGAGDVQVADVPASGTFQVTDTGLRDNTAYSYQVKAIGPATSQQAIPGAAPSGATAPNVTVQNPLVGKSGTAAIQTPPLVAPGRITAAVDATRSNLIHLTWPAAPYAPYYQVLRDNAPLGVAVSTAALDDSPPPGWHDYRVASVATEVGFAVTSPPTHAARIHTGPFRVLAFGDSIMWGQGLLDPHKFTTLVTGWLATSLGVPVLTTNLAHSGAEAREDGSHYNPPWSAARIAQANATDAGLGGVPNRYGEVPNTFPDVAFQALGMGASPALGDPRNVDLVLIDGCINDVGVSNILDPTVSDATLGSRIQTACGASMSKLLTDVHSTYRNARIVVTSYFRIASAQSDLANLAVLAMQAGVAIPAIATVMGIPVPPDPGLATGIILAAGPFALQKLKDFAVARSATFESASSSLLQADVTSLNGANGSQLWATFAQVPFGDANAYGTQSSSWLWTVPISLPPFLTNPPDEAYAARQPVCQAIPPGNPDYDGVKCVVASMGHPNVVGAQQYAAAIESQLQNFLNLWRATLAPVQASP